MSQPDQAIAGAIPQPRQYFVSRGFDFALIGGVSVVTYLVMRGVTMSGRWAGNEIVPIQTLGIWLSFVCNWPHFAATSFRLYHTRSNVTQYPVTALLVPVLMVLAIVGSFLSPLTIAPYFVKLYLIWSPYHFSGQTIGIALIYARRAGFAISNLERMALSGFVYGTFLTTVARTEVRIGEQSYVGVLYPTLGLPTWVVSGTSLLMVGSGLLLALLLVVRWLRGGRLPPAAFLLPAVTQFIWFVPGGTLPGFNTFVPFFHSLQYLVIAWAVQLKERLDEGGITPSRRYVGLETLRWGALNVGIGLLIFWGAPHLVVFAGIAALPFAEGVIHAAIQVHHFFVDGVIWKIKNPRVLSPLMVNIEDLAGRGEAAA